MFIFCLCIFILMLVSFYVLSAFVAEDVINQLNYGRRKADRQDYLLALDWVISGMLAVCYAVLMVIV